MVIILSTELESKKKRNKMQALKNLWNDILSRLKTIFGTKVEAPIESEVNKVKSIAQSAVEKVENIPVEAVNEAVHVINEVDVAVKGE